MKQIQRYTVEIYDTAEGHSPLIEWLESIKDAVTVQRIRNRIDRFELGNLGDHKPLTGHPGLFEARLKFGPRYRLDFTIQGESTLTLLFGGRKGSQRRDITRAANLLKSYLEG